MSNELLQPLPELGADDLPVIDPHGLWNHVCQLFRGCDASDLTIHDRIALINQLQERWNCLTGEQGVVRACTGWRPYRRDGEIIQYDLRPHRCRSPLCPSCFWRIQTACIQAIKEFGPRWPQLYLRETDDQPCRSAPHPLLKKKFQAHNSSYHLVAWCYAFNENPGLARSSIVTGPDLSYTVLHEEYRRGYPERVKNTVYPITYRLVGIFGTEKPVRGSDRNVITPDGQDVGAIFRKEVGDTQHALDLWLEVVSHPSLYDSHSSFGPAIIWAREAGLGRVFGTATPRD